MVNQKYTSVILNITNTYIQHSLKNKQDICPFEEIYKLYSQVNNSIPKFSMH